MNERLQQKIMINISKDEISGCWLWRGQISNSGYGKIKIKDDDNITKTKSAQDVSYMAFIGSIPQGMIARHNCDNRLCVNPEHISIYKP